MFHLRLHLRNGGRTAHDGDSVNRGALNPSARDISPVQSGLTRLGSGLSTRHNLSASTDTRQVDADAV